MSTSPQESSSTAIQLSRDADLLIRNFLPPDDNVSAPPYTSAPLPLPFCTPQITAGYDSPFVRGYNAVLADSVGISQPQLLAFLDGLNLAINASPPLRVVGLAGTIIGLVPYHWAMIAGTAIQVSAGVAMRALSKTLTDRFLRAANKRLFRPRGLVARLMTTPALLHFLDPSRPAKRAPSAMQKAGRAAGSLLMHLPVLSLGSRVVRAIATSPPRIGPSPQGTASPVLARRLTLVEGTALPLNLEVPPPAPPQGTLDTVGSWGVRFDHWRESRRQATAEENRRAVAAGVEATPELVRMIAAQGPQAAALTRGLMSVRNSRGHGQRERRDGRDRGGLVGGIIGGRETRAERGAAEADLREHWATDRLVWLVVLNADDDNEIAEASIADAPEDEELVTEERWETEIALERKAGELATKRAAESQ